MVTTPRNPPSASTTTVIVLLSTIKFSSTLLSLSSSVHTTKDCTMEEIWSGFSWLSLLSFSACGEGKGGLVSHWSRHGRGRGAATSPIVSEQRLVSTASGSAALITNVKSDV